MKQKIALLLVLSMVLQMPVSALNAYGSTLPAMQPLQNMFGRNTQINAKASDSNSEEQPDEEKKTESSLTALNEQKRTSESEKETKTSLGQLKIELTNYLRTKDSKFFVTLEKKDKTAREQELLESIDKEFDVSWRNTLDGGGKTTMVIADISEGKYLLHLEGDEAETYLPYEQDIEIVGGTTTSLYLANDYPEYYLSEEKIIKKTGVLISGNFSEDTGSTESQKLDENDLQEILDAIYSGKNDSIYDLNGDNQVDLIDLEYFAKFYKNEEKERKAESVQRPWVTLDRIETAEIQKGTADQEAIKKLFADIEEDDFSLQIRPEQDSKISKENAVIVSAEFTQPVTMGALAVSPKIGSLDAMEDGEIVLEKENGDNIIIVVEHGVEVSKRTESGSRTKETSSKRSSALKTATEEKTATDSNASKKKTLSGIGVLSISPAIRKLVSAAKAVPDKDEREKHAKAVVIDLKSQIPVKKVTIRITKTVAEKFGFSANLAEISKVEFLNHMEDHIPEPELSIPDKLQGEPGDAQFSVTWHHQANVTGYEVWVKGETHKHGEVTEVFPPQETNSITVTSLGGSELSNNEEFEVKVRSINGDWRSPYSSSIFVETIANKVPNPPESISIKGGHKKLMVSWKKMKSTNFYNLYYREKTDAETEFTKIANIKDTSTEITGLKENTTYEIYMTGENQIGVSAPSERYSGKTLVLKEPQTPNFMLLNVPKQDGGHSDVIISVANGSHANSSVNGGEFTVVDGIYETSWSCQDWDAGCSYPGDNKSPIVTFDQPYEMDTIVIIPDTEQTYAYSQCKIFYWDKDNVKKEIGGRLTRKLDPDGIAYYEFIASEKFTAQKIRVAVQTGYGGARRISFAELKFYRYNSLEDEIFDMYTDSLHIMLKDSVTEEKINDFYSRLEYVDPDSGEKTPRYDFLKQELDNAMMLLKQGISSGKIIYLDSTRTQRQDGHTGFSGGLNVWQPLGVTGVAGDKVMVYVGSEGKNLGDNTSLTVIATQYHGESSAVQASAGGLKVGPNEVIIPKIGNMTSAEQGGQLYIQYGGNYNAEKYAVRVTVPEPEEGKSSAAMIPVLDISGDLTEEEEAKRLETYVAELKTFDSKEMHERYHASIEQSYDERNCIFGATDIVGNRVMFSLPAKEIWRGISTRGEAEALKNSVEAMDQTLTLFYQHKGLSDDPNAGAKNRMPVSRINIRYQRMFEGAFMYAGGAHIGIEWGSSAGMMAGVPLVSDENGKYISGYPFGWGIAHEVGHEINEGAYTVAEVTNNYFAQLTKSRDSNATVRWKYDDVYKKVASGSKGPASNVFISLAMYWQLHLAYDRDYNFKLYDTYEEQFSRLFFARVDSYARNTAAAPKPGNVELKLNSDTDNNLMRLSCAAAEKNILEFFERWGKEPNAETRQYAEQFDKETRGIWLANDDQRVTVIESGKEPTGESSIVVSGSVSYDEHTGNGNEVEIALEASSDENLFGFEVFRCEKQGSETIRRPVGFIPANGTNADFTDVVTAVNNRAFTYEAIAYDIWLRPTKKAVLGQVRVSHNGSLDSEEWTATTNMISADESEIELPDEEDPDNVMQPAINQVVDKDNASTYVGSSKEDPEIVIYLNKPQILTGFEYRLSSEESQNAISSFEFYVSQDGTTWEKAATREAQFNLSKTTNDGTKYQKIIFSSPSKDSEAAANGAYELCIYEASMVKLVAKNQKGKQIAVSEIALYGQTGDRIDWDSDESTGEVMGIGTLDEDYKNPKDGTVLIPAGSLVFTGTYAGNPAYNTVILWNEKDEIVGGLNEQGDLTAEQLIFAPDPGTEDLTNITDGHWIYYLEKMPASLPEQVRAELYRVNDALDQSGQRLVSTTILVDVPDSLPTVSLQGIDSTAVSGQ